VKQEVLMAGAIEVHVVMLAGGSGTRFWPWSRHTRPKQLLALVGQQSLLRQCAERFRGCIPAEHFWAVTTAELLPQVREHLNDLVPQSQLIGEPMGRDTAPCIGLAAALIAQRNPEAVMIAAPADHLIEPVGAFHRSIQAAVTLTQEFPDALITLGIVPNRPATGYGYIRRGEWIGERQGVAVYRVAEFREKPDLQTAEQYLASGEFYWNSGIFVWRVQTILRELARQQPRIENAVRRLAENWHSPQRDALLRQEYAALPKISIDYAVMEGCRTALVLAAPFRWDDLGSWSALERLHPQDADYNTILARHVGLKTRRCIIVGDSNRLIATLGVEDLLIVQSDDAVLVAQKQQENDIRQLVELLRDTGQEAFL
jgi:mannose-1-phosphate guanylyltransferase